MASGYEKADCGVDPNEGWGPPNPTADHVLTVAVFGYAAFMIWQQVKGVRDLIRTIFLWSEYP